MGVGVGVGAGAGAGVGAGTGVAKGDIHGISAVTGRLQAKLEKLNGAVWAPVACGVRIGTGVALIGVWLEMLLTAALVQLSGCSLQVGTAHEVWDWAFASPEASATARTVPERTRK